MSNKSRRKLDKSQLRLLKGARAMADREKPAQAEGEFLDPVPVQRAFLQALLSYLETRPRGEVNRGATSLEILLNQRVKPVAPEKPDEDAEAEVAEREAAEAEAAAKKAAELAAEKNKALKAAQAAKKAADAAALAELAKEATEAAEAAAAGLEDDESEEPSPEETSDSLDPLTT